MAEYSSQEFLKKRKQVISDSLTSDLHGRRIYLLGSAEYGPTNEPVLIKSTIGLHNKFGKHGTLISAFHALKYVSRNNQTYLVKTTGEHATLYMNVNIYGKEIIENGFTIISSESNEAYNDVQVLIDIDKLIIIFPDKLGGITKEYKYSMYSTIELLASAINKETKNNKNRLYAYYSVEPSIPTKYAFCCCNPSELYLCGGDSGLEYSKNLLYNCLSRTYNILESLDIDIIIPVDAFIDDIYPDDSDGKLDRYDMRYYQSTKDYLSEDISGKKLSYLDQLINFCIHQFNFGIITNGIIGFNSHYKYTSDYLYEADDIAKMYKACMEYNLECCLNPFYAFLVSVVAGDIKYNKGTIIDNGYLAYAALCANISYAAGTSNVPISNSISIYQEFSEQVLQDLAKTGIVVYRHSPLYNQPVVYDGITASPENENLKLYANVRMIQLCISYINKLFQFYIGHNMNRLIKEHIIVDDLNIMLRNLRSRNIITQYSFTIKPYYAKGEVRIYLSLMTCYMVKAVKLCSVINVEFDEEELT